MRSSFPDPASIVTRSKLLFRQGTKSMNFRPQPTWTIVSAVIHSKTVVDGGVLRYTRPFVIKKLDVPVSQVDELKMFYRVIASDERSTAVLKPAAAH